MQTASTQMATQRTGCIMLGLHASFTVAGNPIVLHLSVVYKPLHKPCMFIFMKHHAYTGLTRGQNLGHKVLTGNIICKCSTQRLGAKYEHCNLHREKVQARLVCGQMYTVTDRPKQVGKD